MLRLLVCAKLTQAARTGEAVRAAALARACPGADNDGGGEPPMTDTRRGQLQPKGEGLRQALRWLSDEGRHDVAAIDEASRRFDLSPLEEDFLLRSLARKDHEQ